MLSRFLFVVFIAGCATGPNVLAEKAESNTTTAGTKAERLMVEIPEGWQKAVERRIGELHVAEYYPADAHELWPQKLSIEALSGDALADPIDFALDLAAGQKKVCDKFSDNSIFSGFENGYPTTVHMIQCGKNKNTGRSVVTVVKVIRANHSLYTITRIWRLPPPTPPLAADAININQDELAAWSQALRKVIVCDPNLDAHPCPEQPE